MAGGGVRGGSTNVAVMMRAAEPRGALAGALTRAPAICPGPPVSTLRPHCGCVSSSAGSYGPRVGEPAVVNKRPCSTVQKDVKVCQTRSVPPAMVEIGRERGLTQNADLADLPAAATNSAVGVCEARIERSVLCGHTAPLSRVPKTTPQRISRPRLATINKGFTGRGRAHFRACVGATTAATIGRHGVTRCTDYNVAPFGLRSRTPASRSPVRTDRLNRPKRGVASGA